MRRAGHHQRGVALIQALVIVAAIAAVAAALMLRAEMARQRLQTRFEADQVTLYLDSGVAMLAAQLSALPTTTALHRGQDWARPRSGVLIDRGDLAWQVDDLQSRFNVNALNGQEPAHEAAREAFLRLAADHGIRRDTARRLADALGADAGARDDATGDTALPLPLVDPRQLAVLVPNQPEAWASFVAVLAALPDATPLSLNTLDPSVLKALLPDMPSAMLSSLERRLRREPFASMDAFLLWAETALNPEVAGQFEALGLAITSDWFLATLEARLDTLRLRRSVVLTRDEAQGRFVVSLSTPEFEF